MSNYVLVVNVHNEAKKVAALFDTILGQTKKPDLWIWIDDGSTDDTVKRIHSEEKKHNLPIMVLRSPPKKRPNYDSIGKAWNNVFSEIKSLKGYHYLMIVDADCSLPTDYAEEMIEFMDSNSDVGVAAGQVQGETRPDMPMNAGKIVRWNVVRNVDHFWDIVPDTFWNIKAISMGYRIVSRKDVIISASPTKAFSKKGKFRSGRLMYYVGRPLLLVLLQSIWTMSKDRTGTIILRGYFTEWIRGTWKCDIEMIREFYSLRGTLRWKLLGRF